MAGFDASLGTVADTAAPREVFARFLCFVLFTVFFISSSIITFAHWSTHQYGPHALFLKMGAHVIVVSDLEINSSDRDPETEQSVVGGYGAYQGVKS